MPLTPTITRTAPYNWHVDYSGTSPYDVVLEGRYVYKQTTLSSFDYPHTSDTEPPPFEILDANDTTEAASITNPPYGTLQWRRSLTADYYRIEYWDGDSWEIPPGRGTTNWIVRESGQGYYQMDTTALADDTSHQWRVIAVDARGYESIAKVYTIPMVCNPAPPAVAVTWAAGTLTASAA